MNDPLARSWTITRRTTGVAVLAMLGLVGVGTWPRWAFWRAPLDALTHHPDAAALTAWGRYVRAIQPDLHTADLEARLSAHLAQGYDQALIEDYALARHLRIHGWLVPETQTLAGLWLASVADRDR